ncbi:MULTISPECIES: DeoR/GlpR family DNA-binding transcription regulator [Mycetocola]|uniref:Lactose phosphotransferase system repressor n=1 Tax=Mycetocola lacteus TaxID=76637 RepID=A0A3L7AI26_9MICO|nr:MULTISPECIES: DeoR/GlpR family DNA-binding transcription regulator [Mycetocola]MCS4276478.1 DeoR/GlpR family transcriptional regulator of sugar metabolism [Mycetocola sp. BIGb0189]RLP79328.1 DeoR/GlpR transcriptional regulator [Mycetocola lacteus]
MPDVARNQQGARERRDAIVTLLRERGSLAVAELPETFEVSPETIRRDLRELERERRVERRYGVIRMVESGAVETPIAFRETNHTAEKVRIAQAAAGRLAQARTLFLDEGFLPALVAESLPDDRPLTVITASIPAVLRLANRPRIEVIMLGGRIRPATLGAVDFWATRALEGFVPDLAILGANGVSVDGLLTTPDPAVAAVKETAVRVSARRLFVGDHNKFGRTSFVRFANVTDFETMITGQALSASIAREYAERGARIVRV